MAANLRREAALLGPYAGIERHERLFEALETNDLESVLTALDRHGSRRFLTPA